MNIFGCTSWGKDDCGQRLWKARQGNVVAFFSVRDDDDDEQTTMILAHAVLLGLPLDENALDAHRRRTGTVMP